MEAYGAAWAATLGDLSDPRFEPIKQQLRAVPSWNDREHTEALRLADEIDAARARKQALLESVTKTAAEKVVLGPDLTPTGTARAPRESYVAPPPDAKRRSESNLDDALEASRGVSRQAMRQDAQRPRGQDFTPPPQQRGTSQHPASSMKSVWEVTSPR
jgi:hypothetical protein